MKKIVAIGSVIALGVMGNIAMANDGKIDFVGGVTASTCDVSVNKQGKNALIKLPTVASKLLKAAGDTAGRTSVNFQLTNCTLADGKTKASVYFVAGPNINTDGRLTNSQTASGTTNVDLQMLNTDLTPMDLSRGVPGVDAGGQPVAGQGATPVTIDAGTASIRHYAQYYATGAATAGGLRANVEYEINYE